MSIRYGITEETYSLDANTRIAYGIAVYADAENNSTASILEFIPDITTDRERLQALVQICNRLNLPLMHLHDVVEDFFVG